MESDRCSVLQEGVKKGAKYIQRTPDKWKQNIAKKQRQCGENYKSKSTGKEVQGKLFKKISTCCINKCFASFSNNDQKKLFDRFWKGQSRESQGVFLSGCMSAHVAARQRRILEPKVLREHIWEYHLKKEIERVKVCRTFLKDLFQVSVKRIRLIQQKTKDGQSFEERRGHHENRPNKLPKQVWELALAHLKSIPHHQSHYIANRTNRLYFDNPDITIKELYGGFKNYFHEITGNTLTMAYKTYFKFFRETNFTFSTPKSDTCDFCAEHEQKLTINPNDECRVQYDLHKRKAAAFFSMKRNFIDQAKESDEVVVIEFDYAQNLPLPKLTVNKQFYKRLLWLYLFNVHCHNDGTSLMYTFIESTTKKGANSVCSFLFDFLQKKAERYPGMKKLVLLSDGAGGQNKNAILLRFCSFLSKMYDVEIIHVYPVRGHSYGQCDRNFGVVRSSFKKKDIIETPELYYDRIIKCRQNPFNFELVTDATIYDWGVALTNFFLKMPTNKDVKFKIQQYTILKYTTTGSILASKTYQQIFTPFRYRIKFVNELDISNAPRVGLKKAKIKDIRDLYPFLKEESKQFYEQLFNESSVV